MSSKNDIDNMVQFNSLLAAGSAALSAESLICLRKMIDSLLECLECRDIIDQSCTTEELSMVQKKKEQYVLGIQKSKIYHCEEKRGDGSKFERFKARPNGKKTFISGKTYDELISKLYDHYTGEAQDTTLRGIFTDATVWKSQRGVTPKTMREHKIVWDKYIAGNAIAKIQVRKITVSVLKSFYDDLCVKNQLTYKQLQAVRGVISYLMKYCIAFNLIDHNPANDIDYRDLPYVKEAGRKDKIKKTPFPVAMIPEIITWCKDEVQKPKVNALHPFGIIVGIRLGDRYGELRGMKWSDINWSEHTLTIEDQAVPTYTMNEDLTFNYEGHQLAGHIKGYEEPVSIPIPGEAYEALQMIREMNLDDEFVFPENHFRYNTFNNTIKAMAAYLKLDPKKYSSHSLRTTCATDLYKRTHDLFLVQRVLHHTTPEMTQKYIKDLDMDEELRRVMLEENLEDILSDKE